MKSDFIIAVTQLAAERNLPREAVISAIEAALASAYRKDSLLAGQEISVSLNPVDGDVKIFIRKTVVSKVADRETEVSLTQAKKQKSDVALGDELDVEIPIQQTGRIAAQTAKQVVFQRLREAERELVFEEYSDRSGDVVSATVQRNEASQVVVDLGRAEAVIPFAEQVSNERYRPGQKIKVYIVEVSRTGRGAEVIVSRTHRDLLKRLFEMEVPEIGNGVVEIKGVAREPGSRSKVAVYSRQEGVDAVGSCVGLRGIRIQNIVSELQGEKIDVVQWSPDVQTFLANALSPCPVTRVDLDNDEGLATVVVPDRQLSLAIGKDGQNARLCARLSGLKVNIKSVTEVEDERVHSDPSSADVQEDTDVTEETGQVIEEFVSDVEAIVEEKIENVPVSTTEQPVAILNADEDKDDLEVDEQKNTGISIEEQLAEAELDIDSSNDTNDTEATETLELTDVVWSAPQITPETQTIRFAEDIVGTRANAIANNKRKGKQSRDDQGRQNRRPRRVSYEVDDEDEGFDR
tara:strand:+ start:428 stop:1987 length:1560 start_codon:yes stop_codon:yes gene_type:complete